MFNKSLYDQIKTRIGVEFQFKEDCESCSNFFSRIGCENCASEFDKYIKDRFQEDE